MIFRCKAYIVEAQGGDPGRGRGHPDPDGGGGERRGPVPPAAGEDVGLPIPRVSRLLDKRGKKQTSGAAVVFGFLVMSCGGLQIYRKR